MRKHTKQKLANATIIIILMLLSLLLLASCDSGDDKIPMNGINTNQYKVEFIYPYGKLEEKSLCVYKLKTGIDAAIYQDNITIVDSIGKFDIGDLVILQAVKIEK